eukprot:8058400-Alexandrium_andersonii.AAC.1
MDGRMRHRTSRAHGDTPCTDACPRTHIGMSAPTCGHTVDAPRRWAFLDVGARVAVQLFPKNGYGAHKRTHAHICTQAGASTCKYTRAYAQALERHALERCACRVAARLCARACAHR